MNSIDDADGLEIEWFDRVWLNPPYTSSEIETWLCRLADHGNGTALIFARTETAAFERQVWARANGLLFLHGRLHFHDRAGIRAAANAGAPSVLCAYGQHDLDMLAASDLDGTVVPLRFARFMLVAGTDLSWSKEVERGSATSKVLSVSQTPIATSLGTPRPCAIATGARRCVRSSKRSASRVGPALYAAAA
jgi:hypothetical protein